MKQKGLMMNSNIDRYKSDLDKLIDKSEKLLLALHYKCHPRDFSQKMKKQFGESADNFLNELPSFTEEYQVWYSEAQSLIKQLLPDRLVDFIRYYEKPKSRKEISYENYRIEDCLQGLVITRGYQKDKVVGLEAAIPHFRQQIAILHSVKARFESSLFDIHQLVQADLFDSELEAAKELNKHKFSRAAGALAGVVLERHIRLVCGNHNVKLTKKNPTIADYNDALKKSDVIDIVQWRFVQHLGDIRNLCDHDKQVEPSPEQVDDLISGSMKIIKTLF